MLNKYPEIWLRESVMLVDLQTSSIFSPPPFLSSFSFSPLSLFSPGPVSPYKRLTVQRRETGLRHSTQLLLINLHSEEKNVLTCTHPPICLDTESPVRSGMVICSQLICNTDHSGLFILKKKKKKHDHVDAFPGYITFTIFILLSKNSEL